MYASIVAVWKRDPTGSFWNYLSRGCEICRLGAGLVLFVTGRCTRGCIYCPLSDERRGKDLVFADEQPTESSEDILEEANAIKALGTGITGGEPLLELERVIDYIKMLKREFGLEHHIHLYTGFLPNNRVMKRLRGAGLDEIRFHPPLECWSNSESLKEKLSEAINIGLEAGVEIPAFKAAPGIVDAIRSTGAFLNLNELEFSETNAHNLKEMGFRPHELHCGAIGSEEIAKSYMLEGLNVHYCPSRFKDAIQLRERLKRRAKVMARPFDFITDDGTLIYGVIAGDPKKLIGILEGLGVPDRMYAAKENQIQIDPYVLEDISQELKSIGCNVSVVETYPTKKGLIVEKIPL